MHKIIFQGNKISFSKIADLDLAIDIIAKEETDEFISLHIKHSPSQRDIQVLRDTLKIDVNILPLNFDPAAVKLVVSDMDSTLINIECIDEIADFAGLKKEVSAITESAMRGELDFAESLLARVGLLKGLNIQSLQRVYDERLELNPGAKKMIRTLKAHDIKFALVSGGFTFFTDRLKARLGLDYTLSNQLEQAGERLTGNVTGNIIGGEAKAKFLLQTCQNLKISPLQVVAIGDGANDLLMMAEAGMGIAYHAKPTVQEKADCALNYSGLDGLLGLLTLPSE